MHTLHMCEHKFLDVFYVEHTRKTKQHTRQMLPTRYILKTPFKVIAKDLSGFCAAEVTRIIACSQHYREVTHMKEDYTADVA